MRTASGPVGAGPMMRMGVMDRDETHGFIGNGKPPTPSTGAKDCLPNPTRSEQKRLDA